MKARVQALATRFRRLRLMPAVLATFPLWILPLLLLPPTMDYFHLRSLGDWAWTNLRMEVFFHFQRQAIQGALAPDTVPVPNPEMPVLDLQLSPASAQALNADLPRSGFEDKNAWLDTAAGPLRLNARYRGDSASHWFFPKRSWSLRGGKSRLLPWGRTADLINPKDIECLAAVDDIHIAKMMDLLARPITLVALNVNRRYSGVYSCLPGLDESFLREAGEMPSEIRDGDFSHRRGPLRFTDLFADPYVWGRTGALRTPPPWTEEPLAQLVRRLNDGSYWDSPRRLCDEGYFMRFCAFLSLDGTIHYDSFHNLHLYFDPLTGQFKQFECDSSGLHLIAAKPGHYELDISSNLLFSTLLRNPVFNYGKNRYLYERLTEKGFIEGILGEMRRTAAPIEPFVDADKMDRQGLNGSVDPYGWAAPYGKRVEEVAQFILKRVEFLKARLDDARVAYVFANGVLKLDASGYSPCDMIRIIFNSPVTDDLRVYQDKNLNGRYDEGVDKAAAWTAIDARTIEIHDRLYPGRVEKGQGAQFNWHLDPAPLSYAYLMRGGTGLGVAGVQARNAITGGPAQAGSGAGWGISTCDSLHPWSLPETPKPKTIVIAGREFTLAKDWIIGPQDTVEFTSGVKTLLGPGVSILCYGKMLVRGAPGNPVTFQRADPAKPWGAICLNGPAARDSVFERAVFEGGSRAALDNVAYVGMVNVHCAGAVRFEACRFERNSLGAGALRIAKTRAEVAQCAFADVHGNAIALDYCDGAVRDCSFARVGKNAFDLMGSAPVIQGNRIDSAGGTGISIGERSDPIVFDNRVTSAAVGILVRDGSRPLIVNCDIEGFSQGIQERLQDWRYYDGGHALVCNCRVSALSGPALAADKDSSLPVFNSLIAQPAGAAPQGPPAPATDERTTLVDCRLIEAAESAEAAENEAARMKPYLPVYRLIGIVPQEGMRIGAKGGGAPVAPVAPARVVFSDAFQEDFTTNIEPWRANGDVHSATKRERLLELKGVLGGEPRLTRDVPPLGGDIGGQRINGSVLLVEARAPEPASATVVLVCGPKEIRETIHLTRALQNWVFDAPGEAVERVEIHLPRDRKRVDLSRVELRVW